MLDHDPHVCRKECRQRSNRVSIRLANVDIEILADQCYDLRAIREALLLCVRLMFTQPIKYVANKKTRTNKTNSGFVSYMPLLKT